MQKDLKQYSIGIGFTLLSALLIACVRLFVKQLTAEISVSLILILRFSIPSLFLWLFVFITGRVIKIQYFWLLLLRAIFVVAGQYCIFYYLIFGSMLNAGLFTNTSAIFVPIISLVFLGIPIKPKVWFSVIIGFIGIAFVLHPHVVAGNEMWIIAIVGLASGFFNACSQIALHKLSNKQYDGFAITIYVFSFAAVLGVIPLFFFEMLGGTHIGFSTLANCADCWYLLIGMAFVTLTNQFTRIKGYRRVKKAASLMPFGYMGIVFSGVLDWYFYKTTPDWMSIIGAVFIILSGVIMLFRHNNKENIE